MRANPESALSKRIRLALNRLPGVRLVRNTTGFDRGRKIRYGLGLGGPDLVGLAHQRAIAIEVKMPGGRLSRAQEAWLGAFARLGGVGGIARSVEEASAIVERARGGR